MTSWHRNASGITGPFWWESSCHQCIPHTKGQQYGILLFFFVCHHEQAVERTVAISDLRHYVARVTLLQWLPWMHMASWHLKVYITMTPVGSGSVGYVVEGKHYNDVIMSTMASQITSLTIVYSTVYSCVFQRKHQISASLAFVRGIHRSPVNSPHKGPVTRKMFPFDDVIMSTSERGTHANPSCFLSICLPFAMSFYPTALHRHNNADVTQSPGTMPFLIAFPPVNIFVSDIERVIVVCLW